MPVPPGRFGENLRTTGVPVTDAVIGSRWRVGTVTLEVTIARKPCATFARWMDELGGSVASPIEVMWVRTSGSSSPACFAAATRWPSSRCRRTG
nr:MOSC domain-containing protein [Rhodococcus sp. BS-15]